jgi:WD40 repeat protein
MAISHILQYKAGNPPLPPSTRLLTVGIGDDIQSYTLPGLTKTVVKQTGDLFIEDITYNPSKTLVATCSGSVAPYIEVFDPTTWNPVVTLGDGDADQQAIAFSRDGQYLAYVSYYGTKLRIRDTSTWSVVSGTPVPDRFCFDVSWGGNDNYLALGTEAECYVYDTSGWGSITLDPYPVDGGSRVYAVEFSPNGQYLAVGSTEETTPKLFVYSTSTWTDIAISYDRTGVSNVIWDLAWSPDGQYLAVANRDAPYISVLRTSDWSVILDVDGPFSSGVNAVAFSSDGAYLAVGSNNAPNLALFETTNWTYTTPAVTAGVRAIAFD